MYCMELLSNSTAPKFRQRLNALTAKVKEEYAAGKNEGKKHRILITGCPMGGATMKVVKAIEENGMEW